MCSVPDGSHSFRLSFLFLVVVVVVVGREVVSSVPPPTFLGIAPQDREYFESEVIDCRDRSKSFRKDRLNDGFCDCPDGTDEPGTSACPESKFFCVNAGDTPRILFSSRVNDQICDCCDGSDEYDSGITCPNTCRKDTIIANVTENHELNKMKINPDKGFKGEDSNELQELILNIKGLRVAAAVEFVIAASMITYCVCRWRTRSKRRRSQLRS